MVAIVAIIFVCLYVAVYASYVKLRNAHRRKATGADRNATDMHNR
jgi:ABC-type transport system involved in Fe-S cluster assembly fused permease/ATPase subunit